MSVLTELNTAAECLEGARQAIDRAAELAEDQRWLEMLAKPSKDLEGAHWTVQHLIRVRQTVEK